MEATVSVGSRVIIECGKQSGSITRLISGLVRKKGYSRGANGKILYTISGSSTGIRLNERATYAVSEAAKLSTGQIDTSDATRKADTLLQTVLTSLTTQDGIITYSTLATNSDVETFIASLAIEYGEAQDAVNYIEDQSGGEVVVDTNDLVNFRHEIKNNLFGRGFTLKNSFAGAANDDADDTMYLRGKDWSYEDDFYKSANYANRVYGILPPIDTDLVNITRITSNFIKNSEVEAALKFRPTHSHWLPGDIYVTISTTLSVANPEPEIPARFRVCQDSGGVPMNAGGVVANVEFSGSVIPLSRSLDASGMPWVNTQSFLDTSGNPIDSFDLSTVTDYWLIMSDEYAASGAGTPYIIWNRSGGSNSGPQLTSTSKNSSNSAGGTGWTNSTTLNTVQARFPIRRSHSFVMWDPKATQAVSSGLSAGLHTDSVLSDISSQIKTKESMYRHLSTQLYNMSRPRTLYNFPRVLAPNIPPFPGDPIVISDIILGFSTSGNQVVLTTCGDMTYTWGNMGSGDYEAPTILNIQAVGVHPRYK